MDRGRVWPDFRPDWIAYRDEDVIVVCKPSGVSSQAADPEHPDDLVTRLKRYLKFHPHPSPLPPAGEGTGYHPHPSPLPPAGEGIGSFPIKEVYLGVHQRLDKETSGLILYTLRRSANAFMAAQFEARAVEKTYLAAVTGWPDRAGAVLRHYLAPRQGGRVRVCGRSERGARQAVTRIERLRAKGNRSLLRARPDTGRTHQIRVQLAEAGSPVAGDRLYGGADAPRLMLHAAGLRFQRPADNQLIEAESAEPPEFRRFIDRGAIDRYRDPAATRALVAAAIEARWALGRAAEAEPPTTAFRLINGTADDLPGLAVDVYDRWLAAHFSGGAAEAAGETLLNILDELGFEGIYLKRHPRQANLLGDTRDPRLAPGSPARGRPAPRELRVFEYGLPLIIRLADGLRTGLFLDQRENRRRVREMSRGLRVLNLFAYTGGFSVAAKAGGANYVVSVDGSTAALDWCERNVALCAGGGTHTTVAAEVFEALEGFEVSGERFDLVIVDPPSYSVSRGRRFRVMDDLAELVAAAMLVTRPGGRVLASVNHRGMSQNALRRHVHKAARLVGRAIVKLKDLPPQSDFPSLPGQESGSRSVMALMS